MRLSKRRRVLGSLVTQYVTNRVDIACDIVDTCLRIAGEVVPYVGFDRIFSALDKHSARVLSGKTF